MTSTRIMNDYGVAAALLFAIFCFHISSKEVDDSYEDPGWTLFPLAFQVFFVGTIIFFYGIKTGGEEKEDWIKQVLRVHKESTFRL